MPGVPKPRPAFSFSSPVRATLGIDTCFRDSKAFDREAVDQVLSDNLRHVLRLDSAVPYSFWINDHDRPMLALIETQGLVDPNTVADSGCFGKLLQLREDFTFSIGSAGGAGCSLGPYVMTNEDMMLVERQSGESSC